MIPIWLAAAALTGAGSLINNRIQNDAINEQNKQNQRAVDMQRRAADAERSRQPSWSSFRLTRWRRPS
jgi:hypothetical protein